MRKTIREPANHYHHFSLTDPLGVIDFENEEHCIAISDDLYHYLSDSFTWVTSIFSNGETYSGFDYTGVSELDTYNTKKFNEILTAWIKLFKLSNDPILLQVPDNSANDIYVTFNKLDLINRLTSLTTLCDQAISARSGITVYGL